MELEIIDQNGTVWRTINRTSKFVVLTSIVVGTTIIVPQFVALKIGIMTTNVLINTYSTYAIGMAVGVGISSIVSKTWDIVEFKISTFSTNEVKRFLKIRNRAIEVAKFCSADEREYFYEIAKIFDGLYREAERKAVLASRVKEAKKLQRKADRCSKPLRKYFENKGFTNVTVKMAETSAA